MDPQSNMDREVEALDEALARGDIDNKEHTRQLNNLARDYREDAAESAREAYDREMDRW